MRSLILLFLLSSLSLAKPQFGQLVNCTDKASNCAESSNLCTNTAYLNLMREMCPVTCGYCQTQVVQPVVPIYNPPSILCTDSATDCVYWVANGFCTNPFYTDSIRISYCQASCNLCNYVIG